MLMRGKSEERLTQRHEMQGGQGQSARPWAINKRQIQAHEQEGERDI